MLRIAKEGLYCEAGDFYIDPWRGVDRALITHGHSDHARSGSKSYLCSEDSVPVLQARLGQKIVVHGMGYGETRTIGDVVVSFHPAGHVLGSAQIRLERGGEVWVVSGDYKVENDGISGAFEPVPCHTFITESTFGLPVYKWRPQAEIVASIHRWWAQNQKAGRASVLFTYALGKAQRLLSTLDDGQGPIAVHGAVSKLLPAYEMAGVGFPSLIEVGRRVERDVARQALLIAPPSSENTPWMRKFGPVNTAFASGWMRVRGGRRRGSYGEGFAISDHVDWPGLLATVRATGARRVLVTHGYAEALSRYLRERGLDAGVLPTRFVGETED